MSRIYNSNACTVNKYIGSDFDKVAVVADNIDGVKFLADNLDGMEAIIENGDAIVDLANNLQEHQVKELIDLSQGQRTVKLSKVFAIGSAIYLITDRADSRRLLEGIDYEVITNTQLKLNRTYGSDVKLLVVQTVVADKGTIQIIDDKTVLNRPVVYLKDKAVLELYDHYGEIFKPLLVWNNTLYYPHNSIDFTTPLHIVGNDATNLKNGNIIVRVNTPTSNTQEIIFSEFEARVLPKREVMDILHETVLNLIVNPPNPWKPLIKISSPFYSIIRDGVVYFPKDVPFTTSNTWQSDKINWIGIEKDVPEEIDLTGMSNIPFTSGSQVIEVMSRQLTNITQFTNVDRYHKYTVIPTNRNITLVQSDTLKLISGTTLNLHEDRVYEFYIDSNNVARQVV